jgi:hypothetical protein
VRIWGFLGYSYKREQLKNSPILVITPEIFLYIYIIKVAKITKKLCAMKTKFYLLGLAAALCIAACTEKDEKNGKEPAKEDLVTVTFQYEKSDYAYKVLKTVKKGERITPPQDTVYREGFRLLGWSSSNGIATELPTLTIQDTL